MATTVWPIPGYPFLLEVTATYRLGDDGLTTQLRARNVRRPSGAVRRGPAPLLHGRHRPGRHHAAHGARPAPGCCTDERGNPTGREDVDGSPYDFRVAATDRRPAARHGVHRPGRRRRRPGAGAPGTAGRRRCRAVDRPGDPLGAGVHRRHPGARAGDASAPRSSRCPARPAPWCPATTSSCSPPARSTSWSGVSTAGERGMDIQARHVLAFILVGSCSASNDSNARADHRLGRSCLPGPDLSGPARERAIDDPGAAPCGSRHRFLAKERQ